MEPAYINRIKLFGKAENFLTYLHDLYSKGILSILVVEEKEQTLLEQMNKFGISLDFNFKLWEQLKSLAPLFNYLKISKSFNAKYKWYLEISKQLPDLNPLYEETHYLFDKYKEILETLLEAQANNTDPSPPAVFYK